MSPVRQELRIHKSDDKEIIVRAKQRTVRDIVHQVDRVSSCRVLENYAHTGLNCLKSVENEATY